MIPALRPIAKTIIKTGLIAYDQGRLALADLGERTGDIMAEAQSELADATASPSDRDEQKPTRGSRKGRVQPDQSSAFAKPDYGSALEWFQWYSTSAKTYSVSAMRNRIGKAIAKAMEHRFSRWGSVKAIKALQRPSLR
jgi:Protein of unknown function (DUF5132)